MSGIICDVSLDIVTHHTASYQVQTEVYEGPLDLLLQLIERAELDITRLALAQVTDQYLERLHGLQGYTTEEVSAFLVIAVRLLQIKSEALLPRPPSREPGEEDPSEALAQQLIAYKRYRQIAELLAKRETADLRTHLRLASPTKAESVFDLNGLGLEDLVMAARFILNKTDRRTSLGNIVTVPKVTIREKIQLIARILCNGGQATFRALLGGKRSRLDIVVTFLAVLELVKLQFVQVHQAGLFDEIEVDAVNSWEEDENFDLEFGE
jgi:segregation and condensation protein A